MTEKTPAPTLTTDEIGLLLEIVKRPDVAVPLAHPLAAVAVGLPARLQAMLDAKIVPEV